MSKVRYFGLLTVIDTCTYIYQLYIKPSFSSIYCICLSPTGFTTPMSVATSTGISWKSALAGAVVALLSMAPLIWRLTRQSRVMYNVTPEPKRYSPVMYMAMGSAATLLTEWMVLFLCRKSRWILGGDLKFPENPETTDSPSMTFQPKCPSGAKGDPEDVALPTNQGSNGRSDAKCQAPTTYSALRGVRRPRFQPLPDDSWG